MPFLVLQHRKQGVSLILYTYYILTGYCIQQGGFLPAWPYIRSPTSPHCTCCQSSFLRGFPTSVLSIPVSACTKAAFSYCPFPVLSCSLPVIQQCWLPQVSHSGYIHTLQLLGISTLARQYGFLLQNWDVHTRHWLLKLSPQLPFESLAPPKHDLSRPWQNICEDPFSCKDRNRVCLI